MVRRNEESSFSHLLEEFEIGGSQSVEIKELELVSDNTQQEDVNSTMEIEEESTIQKSSDKTLKCKECGQVLNTRTGLRLHMLAHKGSKQFTCDICGNGK
jgi:ribosomal protein S27E